ncbi:MAG: FtsX-like permease family protein, partial [Proteobacteria bacterium]|nr:FtsX-like permease family protein [Pseudomonadota bacterium]
IGARAVDIRRLFIVEALLLALVGAIVGLAAGLGATATIAHLYPSFPVAVPSWAIVVAVLVSMLSGIVFGVLPARRAAALDRIEALSNR